MKTTKAKNSTFNEKFKKLEIGQIYQIKKIYRDMSIPLYEYNAGINLSVYPKVLSRSERENILVVDTYSFNIEDEGRANYVSYLRLFSSTPFYASSLSRRQCRRFYSKQERAGRPLNGYVLLCASTKKLYWIGEYQARSFLSKVK